MKNKNTTPDIYLDYAAGTPIDDLVIKKMKKILIEIFGNPSSLSRAGREATRLLEKSRSEIADIIGARAKEVFFFKSATEALNAAILGFVRALEHKKDFLQNHKPRVIVSRLEHRAVLSALEFLTESGQIEIDWVEPSKDGTVEVENFTKFFRKETSLVIMMSVNNEIGTVFPVEELGREILKWRKKTSDNFPFFLTDACQAPLYKEIKVDKIHADFLILSSGKIYGPRGASVLYRRLGIPVSPIFFGGGQENGLCPGTENLPSIVGMSTALGLAEERRISDSRHVQKIRDYFWKKLLAIEPKAKLNGPEITSLNRSPANLNFSLPNLSAEDVLICLSEHGVSASSGSACLSKEDGESSHVLRSIGLPESEARNSLRFTFGRLSTKKEVDITIAALKKILALFKKAEKYV